MTITSPTRYKCTFAVLKDGQVTRGEILFRRDLHEEEIEPYFLQVIADNYGPVDTMQVQVLVRKLN